MTHEPGELLNEAQACIARSAAHYAEHYPGGSDFRNATACGELITAALAAAAWTTGAMLPFLEDAIYHAQLTQGWHASGALCRLELAHHALS